MNESLTVSSIAQALEADKNGRKNKVYKELSDEHKSEQISLSIRSTANALRESINAPKVNLSDTQQVQERTFMYLEACSLSSCFPSVMGLSSALGCSRQNLHRWLVSHPDHPTTDFISMVKDGMADVLTNASLYNNANAAQAIFQLKNHFEHADKIEIAPVVSNTQPDSDYNADEIRRRYMIDDSEEE